MLCPAELSSNLSEGFTGQPDTLHGDPQKHSGLLSASMLNLSISSSLTATCTDAEETEKQMERTWNMTAMC